MLKLSKTWDVEQYNAKFKVEYIYHFAFILFKVFQRVWHALLIAEIFQKSIFLHWIEIEEIVLYTP